ncbi:MAG TPA: DUF1223 domain-containing protein [Chthoniobacterales bacterium]|jgi:hypothetical protein
MKIVSAVLGFSLGMISLSAGAGIHFESGPSQTALVELYTSEGCSSCPPAEARLSRLKDDTGLWKQFVPVAYHVDYWDRLGWRDRFSSENYTARQSRYAALWRSESVYTPAYVVDGKEWRNWSANIPSPDEQAGRLSATSADGKDWSIDFQPAKGGAEDWEVHAALLGTGISSKIGAGENSGRKLEHDFVVLVQQDAPLQAKSNHAVGSLAIPPPSESAPRKAVAIWVSRRGQLTPVQATGGWLAAR